MISTEELRRQSIELGLEQIEHRLASLTRGAADLSAAERNRTENLLLQTAVTAATLDPNAMPSLDGSSDLPMTLLARALGNAHHNGAYSTSYFLSLAALCYASVGNFSTAGVLARKSRLEGNKPARNWAPESSAHVQSDATDEDPAIGLDDEDTWGDETEFGARGNGLEQWALDVLSDHSVLNTQHAGSTPMQPYMDALGRALASGEDGDFVRAKEILQRLSTDISPSASSSDTLILMLWMQVHPRFQELSTARSLRNAVGLSAAYLRALLATPVLYPTQKDAIAKGCILDPTRNAFVSLPTSTGKSLLGELALVSSLTDQRPLGVYIAPYRALVDQLEKRMRSRLHQAGIVCEIRRGGYLIESRFLDRTITNHQKTIIVATPEAFDSMLRQRSDLYDLIACCVFDEFHLVEQSVRGIRYEGLVGRFREVERQGRRTKLVFLSPVVSASAPLMDWLGVRSEDLVESQWRPTARRLAIAGPNRLAQYFTPNDHLTQESDNASPDWTVPIPFPNAIQSATSARFGRERNEYEEQVSRNIVEVALDQYRRINEPVLILCTTRDQTRQTANLVRVQLADLPADNSVRQFAEELKQRYPFLFSLYRCLIRGVAYHNAALPDWVRHRLEDFMSRGELKLVAATTTLAEGVDLPFRTVVLAHWKQWMFGSYQPMPTLLFRNIAGRCGRAGMYAEGDTVIVDNPGAPRTAGNFASRTETYKSLYVRPNPSQLRSSVVARLVSDRPELQEDETAAIESQLAAFLQISNAEDGEADNFAGSLYAGTITTPRRKVESIASTAIRDLLSEEQFRIVERGSPLHFTAFGQSVLKSGLSPRSGLTLAKFLSAYSPSSEPTRGRQIRNRHGVQWEPLTAFMVEEVIANEHFIAEFETGSFLRIGSRGYPIRPDNLQLVTLAWLSGLPIDEIGYLTLRSQTLKEAWEAYTGRGGDNSLRLEMEKPIEEWTEDVATFCTDYFGHQLAWIWRSAALIAEQTAPALADDCRQLASRFEYGVKSTNTIEILRASSGSTRGKVDWLMQQYESTPGEFSIARFVEWLREKQSTLVGQKVGFLESGRVSQLELDSLLNTLS